MDQSTCTGVALASCLDRSSEDDSDCCGAQPAPKETTLAKNAMAHIPAIRCFIFTSPPFRWEHEKGSRQVGKLLKRLIFLRLEKIYPRGREKHLGYSAAQQTIHRRKRPSTLIARQSIDHVFSRKPHARRQLIYPRRSLRQDRSAPAANGCRASDTHARYAYAPFLRRCRAFWLSQIECGLEQED